MIRYCGLRGFWRRIVIPAPLLFLSYSDIISFLKHSRVLLRSFSVLRDKKRSKENPDITILSIRNFDTRKKWNTKKGFSTIFSRIVTQKDFWWKSWHSLPPPLLVHITFQYQKFLKQSRVVDEVYRFCETTVILKKIVDLRALAKKRFRYQKLCETEKVFSTKWFCIVRGNIFGGKSWYPLLSYP